MAYQSRRTPIGRRRERVQVQQRTLTTDGIGGQTATWRTVAKPWVSIVPLDGRDQERLASDQLTVTHNYHFDMRYRTGVKPEPKMRVVWRDQTLEIRTVVDDDAMQRRLILQCSVVQDAYAAA